MSAIKQAITGTGNIVLGANTLTVAGTSSVSGTNTGDQTSVTGNAGTATALATARNIFNISFDGTANVAGDATNTGHFASIPGTGAAGHFVTQNGTAPTVIAGRSAWYSDGSGVPSFKNGTGTAVTLVRSSDLGTGIATFLATPSSANLAAAVTDETGSGALTFATSPTFTTSIIAGSSTMALLNTTATTINFGGGATTAINVGNSTGDFIVKSGELLPDVNDGTALGSSSKGFSDLFLASGAVINFNNGDVTVTHSSDTLTVAGSTNLTVTSGVTTGSGLAITSSTLSSGKLLSLASTSTTYGTQYGLDVSLTGSYSSSAYTSYGVNVVNSRYGSFGSCTTYGALFTVSNAGSYSNTHYGVSSVVSNYQYGTGTNYGFHTSITNGGSSSTNYGVYSSVSSTATTNYAGWFSAGSGTTNWAIYVSAGDVGTALTTLNCFNTTATTVNAFGAATLLTIGGAGASASMFAPSTLDATSSITGAIRTSGGISAAKALHVGTNINIPTTTASAGIIYQNGTRLMHTYGTSNMFVGVGSGNFTLSGSYNVGIGAACLDEITSGQFNVGFGYNTLSKVSSGTNNTGVGNNTLELISTHNDNTAIGSAAMYQTVGSGNTAIGTHAGRALSGTQTNCTWIGHYSGFTGSTGGLTNATALGYNVQTTASNSVVIGNTSVSATQLAGNVTIIAAGGSGNLTVPGSIEIGHATDTTLARVSAGVLSVEGNQLATRQDLFSPFSKAIYLREEFAGGTSTSGQYGELGWTKTDLNGTGSATMSVTMAGNSHGVCKFTTGTTSGNSTGINLYGPNSNGLGNNFNTTIWEVWYRVKISDITDVSAYIGLFWSNVVTQIDNAGSGSNNKGYFICFDTAITTPDTQWSLKVCDDATGATGNVSTAAFTGAITADTYYTFRMRGDGTGTTYATMYDSTGTIVGSEISVASTNAISNACNLFPQIATRTNAARSMSVDFIGFYHEVTR